MSWWAYSWGMGHLLVASQFWTKRRKTLFLHFFWSDGTYTSDIEQKIAMTWMTSPEFQIQNFWRRAREQGLHAHIPFILKLCNFPFFSKFMHRSDNQVQRERSEGRNLKESERIWKDSKELKRITKLKDFYTFAHGALRAIHCFRSS